MRRGAAREFDDEGPLEVVEADARLLGAGAVSEITYTGVLRETTSRGLNESSRLKGLLNPNEENGEKEEKTSPLELNRELAGDDSEEPVIFIFKEGKLSSSSSSSTTAARRFEFEFEEEPLRLYEVVVMLEYPLPPPGVR
jgi:hypothetical protein